MSYIFQGSVPNCDGVSRIVAEPDTEVVFEGYDVAEVVFEADDVAVIVFEAGAEIDAIDETVAETVAELLNNDVYDIVAEVDWVIVFDAFADGVAVLEADIIELTGNVHIPLTRVAQSVVKSESHGGRLTEENTVPAGGVATTRTAPISALI